MIVRSSSPSLIFGVLAGFERAFNAGAGQRGRPTGWSVVNKINFTQPLPLAYVNRVRGIDGVARLTHANWFGGYFQEPKNFLIVFAVEPETYMDALQQRHGFPAGGAAQPSCAIAPARMVGETLADQYGWKVGDHIPISSQHLHAEERRAHLGLSPSRHLHERDAADRHQLHDLPIRLFRRDPLLRQAT